MRVCIFMIQAGQTAHRVESSSPWFHYSMLITASARHFSFSTRLTGAEPTSNHSVIVQTWNRSHVTGWVLLFFFFRLRLKYCWGKVRLTGRSEEFLLLMLRDGSYTDSIASAKFVSSPQFEWNATVGNWAQMKLAGLAFQRRASMSRTYWRSR